MSKKVKSDLSYFAELQPLRATALATLDLVMLWADKSLE